MEKLCAQPVPVIVALFFCICIPLFLAFSFVSSVVCLHRLCCIFFHWLLRMLLHLLAFLSFLCGAQGIRSTRNLQQSTSAPWRLSFRAEVSTSLRQPFFSLLSLNDYLPILFLSGCCYLFLHLKAFLVIVVLFRSIFSLFAFDSVRLLSTLSCLPPVSAL